MSVDIGHKGRVQKNMETFYGVCHEGGGSLTFLLNVFL